MAAETVELGTIYLVDLVGSTRLATSVGPVRWDEMREQFFGLLREAIDASGGREFKNTGDGLMVAFASASAAVGCAVLTQQLFERRYRGAEQRLRVRIGLGTGESTVKDGEYFGMPATEAARLCDKAPADGILVSPATRLLASRVDGARFESFGELELKGIAGADGGLRGRLGAAGGRVRDPRRSVAGAGGAADGAAGRVCRPGGRAGAAGALARAGARGRATGGASVRRARDREDPARFVCGARRERGRVRGLLGGVLGGSGGAV